VEEVYLCIKPKKRSLCIETCINMVPRYCGPLNILERIVKARF